MRRLCTDRHLSVSPGEFLGLGSAVCSSNANSLFLRVDRREAVLARTWDTTQRAFAHCVQCSCRAHGGVCVLVVAVYCAPSLDYVGRLTTGCSGPGGIKCQHPLVAAGPLNRDVRRMVP